MSTTEKVLEALEMNKGRYLSGGELAETLCVSRNAVWKSVKQLQSKGYEITAVTNKGYMLSENSQFISAHSVQKYVNYDNVRVVFKDTVTSTNALVKEAAEKGEREGMLMIAAEQTEGKGRLGRQFLSPRGTGVYFSLLLRPELAPSKALLITTCAAVATAKAIEKHTSKPVGIKWVNDIYMNGKKVAGILTGAAFDLEGNKLNYAVLGIGINMYFNDDTLPPEIKDIATSVFKQKPDGETVSKIVADTVNFFLEEYAVLEGKHFLFDYKSRSMLDGKRINVIKPLGTKQGTAVEIDDDFRLHVKYDDSTEEFLSSGEVSTRLG